MGAVEIVQVRSANNRDDSEPSVVVETVLDRSKSSGKVSPRLRSSGKAAAMG
jgi:hypothetical protein